MMQEDTPWSVVCSAVHLADLFDYHSPVVEMDVAARCIRLGVASPNTELHGERTGAVVRRFLEERVVDWSKAIQWLAEPEAMGLMARLDAGIVRTQLWSGDVVVDWSETATAAADALFVGIGTSVT